MGTHFKRSEEQLTTKMILVGAIIIALLVVSLIVYLINTNSIINEDIVLEGPQISEIEEDDDEFETVSIDIGKSVNEAKNELVSNTTNNVSGTNVVNTTNSVNKTVNSTTATNVIANTNVVNEDTKTVENIKFEAPVKGEVAREFAPDSLVYSETLEEWITHKGIDIKADKTSVVKASEKGTVYAIKSDPRYGLTVIVNHEGGYQTVYANLLTAEYVVEGEQLEKGQTIGTVGNTATFEIADDYHLHFEVLKDGEYVNPCNCMEF